MQSQKHKDFIFRMCHVRNCPELNSEPEIIQSATLSKKKFLKPQNVVRAPIAIEATRKKGSATSPPPGRPENRFLKPSALDPRTREGLEG
jgi:hypothetical protein